MNDGRHDLWSIIDGRDRTINGLQSEIVGLSRQLEIFQQQIVHLDVANAQLRSDLAVSLEKLAGSQIENRSLRKYRRAFGPLPAIGGSLYRASRRRFEWRRKYEVRLRTIFRPRLGWLSQYEARPLSTISPESERKLPANPAFISIVTPSFGQGEYIEETLRSVLDQGYPNLEYFVQDGGSKDETVAVLQKYEKVLSGWVSETDSGQSQAINLGFARTSGEIMGWLNSDDVLLPGSLNAVADYFSRNPDVDVVYGNRLMIDGSSMEIGRWIMPGHRSDILSWADYVPQETMFWRRSIWEKVGGEIDEGYRFAMDWDLLVRFRDAGAKFAHIPRFLGAFRIHEHQKTSAVISEVGFVEMDRIRERTLGHVPTRSEIRKAIAGFLAHHLLVDIAYRVKSRLRR